MAAAVVTDAVVYGKFELVCKWQRSQDTDLFQLHLKDFKREQLKVQIANHGILKVSGQRALLDASKYTKFYKEIYVPTNIYDTQSIRAKFDNNILTITLPKLKISSPEITDKVPSSEPSKTDQTPAPESTTRAPPDIGGGSPGGNALTGCSTGSILANVAVSVAILVLYIMFMYKSLAEIDD